MTADAPTDSTLDPAPATFADTLVPFFRGQVCVPHEVQSGAAIPVTLSPCLHPCLATTSFAFTHNYACIGSSCEAYATMWVVASSGADGCPADAFGRFDPGMCVYDSPVNLGIATTLDSGPVSGSMELEVPFLSNEDIVAIAADNKVIADRAEQYPADPGRVPDGRPIQLLPGNPEPPAECDGAENCPCYEVGF